MAELCDLCELQGTEEGIIPKSWDQTLAGSRLEPVGHRPKLILCVIVWLMNRKVTFFTIRLCCSLPSVSIHTFKFTVVIFWTLWSSFGSWSIQRSGKLLSMVSSSCCWCQLFVTSFKLKKKQEREHRGRSSWPVHPVRITEHQDRITPSWEQGRLCVQVSSLKASWGVTELD